MAKEKFSLENLSELSKGKMEREEEISAKLRELPRLSKKAIAREEEISAKLRELPRLSKKSIAREREITEELKQLPKGGLKKEPSADTREALEELRAIKEEKIKQREEKKLRRELAEKEEVLKIEPEQIIEEKELEEEISEQRGDKAMAEYLKNAISAHPELLTPEIKKNVGVITKQEVIITKNEDNAKKGAQEKVRNAEEIIKRAKPAVNEYIKNIIKDYEESAASLNEIRETYEDAQDKLFSEKYNNYDVGKGSAARFFKERKLKKQLKPKEFEKFEELKMAYYDAFSRYDQLLKKHTKKYGRLENALEAGTSFQIAHRGGGEKLPGVRGR